MGNLKFYCLSLFKQVFLVSLLWKCFFQYSIHCHIFLAGFKLSLFDCPWNFSLLCNTNFPSILVVSGIPGCFAIGSFYHDDVITWKSFLHYWPFVWREIIGDLFPSPCLAQDSLVVPFWRLLDGFRNPPLGHVISSPGSQTSTQQGGQ